MNQEIKVSVEVSARHCHLSKEVLEKLFGKGHELKKVKQLSQPSDFACEETIEVQIGSKRIENVRVVGPLREKTQVEISLTDAVGSGIIPPTRLSGNLENSSGAILIGRNAQMELAEGLIIAQRHLHCDIESAEKYKLKTGDVVSVKVGQERKIIFEEVVVRVKDNYKLCLHLDTDEGNAAGINKISEGLIL